jgi:hypothetical protein
MMDAALGRLATADHRLERGHRNARIIERLMAKPTTLRDQASRMAA